VSRSLNQKMDPKPDPHPEAEAEGAKFGYRPGSKADFDRLYRTTYQRIFATLVIILRDRAAAEDATQEAYLRAFKAWSRWKQDAPAEAWMHRIALNVAFSHRRRERLHEVGELLRRLGRPRLDDPTEVTQPDLVRELKALPPKQAAAIILRHLHGYTNREIGAALNVPERTVASRLAAAKARLRKRLGDQSKDGLGTAQRSTVPLEE
jgi:RNA polymerase sigma-70 factor (ECF subfamily)